MSQPFSVEERFHTARVIQLAAVAALGGFLFGFDTAVINGAVTPMRDDFGMSAGLTGFVVSSALLACLVGAYRAGALADRIGRIRVMVLAAVLFTVSAIGSGLAFGPWDMILWRAVGGIGVGAASVIAPKTPSAVRPPRLYICMTTSGVVLIRRISRTVFWSRSTLTMSPDGARSAG